MQKQTLQLAVSDPLGFEPFQDFAALVADMVGDAIDRAPQPLNDFNPLRAGCIELLNLRLIDSFGRYIDLDWDRITCPYRLSCSWDDRKMYLTPRIAEPARFSFHWITADNDEIEQRTPLPPATPVCGWVLTNHLENSIAVYDADGTALGSWRFGHQYKARRCRAENHGRLRRRRHAVHPRHRQRLRFDRTGKLLAAPGHLAADGTAARRCARGRQSRDARPARIRSELDAVPPGHGER
jgi:hypothetical protein